MRQENFTEQAQDALGSSQLIVRQFQHSQWDVEHVLLALLQQDKGVVCQLLDELGIDIKAIKGEVSAALSKAPKAEAGAQIYATPRIAEMFQAAHAEAQRLQDDFISTEHLFIAIAAESGGQSAEILKHYGIDKEKVYAALEQLGLSLSIRPHQVATTDYHQLYKLLENI